MSRQHEEDLLQRGLIKLDQTGNIQIACQLTGNKAVHNWIFTPTHGRATGKTQAFMDWSKAMGPDAEYVRVLVVKAEELTPYQQQLQAINAACRPWQQTMIMVMPKKLSLRHLSDLSIKYKEAVQGADPNDSLGIGYARLCIQLVAQALQLSDVWMLDDNIQDCWQLDLDAKCLRSSQPTHGPLLPCTFGAIMQGIEEQVHNTMFNEAQLDVQQTVRCWNADCSPRKRAPCTVQSGLVQSWFDYSGDHKHYGIIGPSRQPYRYKLVGATWPGGAGPPAFKVTHSVFCFFLLNVRATMSSRPLVLWPARQFAEDIEFHHLCEDSKLAVIKCNRFFFHKSNLQGLELKKAYKETRIGFQPAQGPMWGGQQLQVQALPNAQIVTSISLCGTDVACPGRQASVFCIKTPALEDPKLLAAPAISNVIVTGSVRAMCGGQQVTADQQYTYHGLWKWAPGTGVDNTCPDPGRSANHVSGSHLCSAILSCKLQGSMKIYKFAGMNSKPHTCSICQLC